MIKRRLTDDEFIEVFQELYDWKERDERRNIKFKELIEKANKKRKIRHLIGWLAGVAAIALIMWLMPSLRSKTNETNETLYFEFYEPYRFATDYRDGNLTTKNLFDQSVKAYQNKHWDEANTLVDSLSLIGPANPDFLLLKGLVKQANGMYQESVSELILLIPSGGSYALNAGWYLALAYLKEGKIKACREQLKTLEKSKDAYYFKRVKQLLKRTERLNSTEI